MHQKNVSTYDMFIAYSGDDRPRVRELRDALKSRGDLAVFVDEHDIRFAHSITGEIQDALRRSKTMLLYYSKSFSARSACQFELHHAYLSALGANEITQRILVINPDDPDTDHLMPLEVRAHRFWRTWSSKADLAVLVDQLRHAVRQVETPFPDIDFSARSTTHHTSPGPATSAFVGRYRDLWRIHSVLHQGEHALVDRVTANPVAALTGMTGVGKSSLLRVYIHDFGFLYRTGVHWITLAGAGGAPDVARTTHTDQLLRLAETLGEHVPGHTRAAVLAWWNRRLRSLDAPVLWVVDDVPDQLPEDVLRELTPDAPHVHVVLVGQQEIDERLAVPVRLGRMTPEDGRELFTRDRPTDSDESDAVDEVVERLGGHPFAILLAAAHARGREGLWAVQDRLDHLTTDASVLDMALRAVRRTIGEVAGARRVVLGLAAVCSAAPLPAPFIRDVLAVLAPGDHENANVVLAAMDRAMLVDQVGTSWQVHQLVREAARQTLVEGELNTVAAVAAHTLLELADNGTPGLVEHAVALLDRTADSHAYADRLNILAAEHYTARGEPLPAASHYENLASAHPDVHGYLIEAARARRAAGHPDRALAHLDSLDQGAVDELTGLSAAALRAAVLDDKGMQRQAEATWARVIGHPQLSELAVPEQIAVRTAHVRNRRMLGHFAEARSLATDLISTMAGSDATEVDLIPLRLELVVIDLATDKRQSARTEAQEVLNHYERLGLPGHINAVEAAILIHEGQFDVFIMDKLPDTETLTKTEADLRRQLTAARREFGPHNARTLGIEVTHMRALVELGNPDRLLEECGDLPETLAVNLGREHRLHLRAVYLLGLALSQQGDHRSAANAFRRAMAGQRIALGPGHPETLATTYELGVCQWREGDRAAARTAFQTVMRDVAEQVGRRNNLYGKALAAMTLSSILPSSVFRTIEMLDRGWRKR